MFWCLPECFNGGYRKHANAFLQRPLERPAARKSRARERASPIDRQNEEGKHHWKQRRHEMRWQNAHPKRSGET